MLIEEHFHVIDTLHFILKQSASIANTKNSEASCYQVPRSLCEELMQVANCFAPSQEQCRVVATTPAGQSCPILRTFAQDWRHKKRLNEQGQKSGIDDNLLSRGLDDHPGRGSLGRSKEGDPDRDDGIDYKHDP
jgi:hypothetical protein